MPAKLTHHTITGNQYVSKGSKRASTSLAQVAAAAGVSKMTASRVLRNKTGFSEATRERVMREVTRLGYVPNRIAAAFGSESASTLVGICVPRFTSTLFSEVLESINNTVFRFGYQTMIGSSEQSAEVEETWLKELLSWRPAGVILTGRSHTLPALELLRGAEIPVVEIWDLNTSPLDVSVGFNHFDCGREMGQYIVSRGRRRVGYVGVHANAGSRGTSRFEGFATALSDAGHPVAATEFLHDRPGFYVGYYGTENILSRASDLDAIYYQDDTMAIGGYFYCMSIGLKVPQDIGIAGWGGMEPASILPLRLTTTAVPTHRIGKKSAEALMARLKGEPSTPVNIVPTRLVQGDSV